LVKQGSVGTQEVILKEGKENPIWIFKNCEERQQEIDVNFFNHKEQKKCYADKGKNILTFSRWISNVLMFYAVLGIRIRIDYGWLDPDLGWTNKKF
jgi:hypothetical protein